MNHIGLNIAQLIKEEKAKKPKKKRSTYKKPYSIKQLQKDVWEAKKIQSSLPDYAVPKPIYSDKNANELTKSIIAYINFIAGGYSYRVQSQGTYDAKLRRYRNSNTVKGQADISASHKGRNIQIEVKIGRDKLSEHQEKFRDRIEKAGGYFIVAKSFDGFLESWSNLGFNKNTSHELDKDIP